MPTACPPRVLTARTLLLFLALLLAGYTAEAQPARLVVDHAAGTVALEQGGRRVPVAPGGVVAVGSGPVEVAVERTRTPFYTYALTTGAAAYPDRDVLYAFLGKTGGAAVDLLTTQFRPRTRADVGTRALDFLPGEDTEPEALRRRLHAGTAAMQGHFSRLQGLLFRGEEARLGLQQVHIRLLAGLGRMSHTGTDPDAVAEGLWRELGTGFSGETRRAPGHLLLVPALLDTYQALDAEAAALHRTAGALAALQALTPSDSTLAAVHLREADVYLQGAAVQFALAADVERMAARALAASAVWRAPEPVTLSYGASQKVTIHVRPDPSAGTAADAAPVAVEVTLERRWPVRPGLGLSLLYVPDALYPSAFGTEAVPGGLAVVSTAEQDARFQWAFTLSLTPAVLERGPFALSGQLHLNPSESVKALGAGAALSYGFLQLSAGAVWTKHAVLDGVAVGDLLPEDAALRTRQSYGAPRFYVGFSLRGVPPFR
jgi:hypothetical protein